MPWSSLSMWLLIWNMLINVRGFDLFMALNVCQSSVVLPIIDSDSQNFCQYALLTSNVDGRRLVSGWTKLHFAFALDPPFYEAMHALGLSLCSILGSTMELKTCFQVSILVSMYLPRKWLLLISYELRSLIHQHSFSTSHLYKSRWMHPSLQSKDTRLKWKMSFV